MKPLHNNPYSSHQDISLLLPWYVNKSLHDAEIKQVENHLNVCLTCRRELVTLQKLAAAVQQEGSLDSAAQVSFSRLKKRIHTSNAVSPEKTPETPVVAALPGKRKGFGKPGFAQWALPQPAFALAAILLLSLMMPRFIDTGTIQQNDYRTLSDAENPVVNQNTLRVIFSNDTQQPQINDILASIQGRIIDGPTAQGIYTVAVDSELASKEVLDRIMSLRKNTRVIFAEPAYALLSSANDDKSKK